MPSILEKNNDVLLHIPPGKRAVVGYEDGTIRVWDLKHGNAIHVIKGKTQAGTTECVAPNYKSHTPEHAVRQITVWFYSVQC